MLSDSKIALGCPRARPMSFFLAPGPLPRPIWSAPGAHSGPTWGPLAPQRAPRAHFRPPGGPPGTVFGIRLIVFRCHTDVLRLLFACFCVCVCVFARVFFKASIANLQSNNPKSLKPWGAAGGREAIRIKCAPGFRACFEDLANSELFET